MKIQNLFHSPTSVQTLFFLDGVFLCFAAFLLAATPAAIQRLCPGQPWTSQPHTVLALGIVFAFGCLAAFTLANASERRILLAGLGIFSAAHLVLAASLQPLRFIKEFGSSRIFFGDTTIDEHGKTVVRPLIEMPVFGVQNTGVKLLIWLAALVFIMAFVKFASFQFGTGRLAMSPGRLRTAWEQQIREAASQEERHRMARDLHDSIKQQIFAIQASVAAAQVRLANGVDGAREALEDARQSARDATVEMEAMLDQLQAAPLENQGLAAAIQKQCEALGFRTGAQVRTRIAGLPPSEWLPPGAHQALYRIVQESLSNIARHARATEVDVELTSSSSHLVTLRIRDNGCGFDVSSTEKGMGLQNLSTRAAEVGGVMAIQSGPGAGAQVEVSIQAVRPTSFRNILQLSPVPLLGLFGVFLMVSGNTVPATLLFAISLALFLRTAWAMRKKAEQ